MTRKCPVRFGGGRKEKDAAGCPSLPTHMGSRTPASDGTSPAAYPTGIASSVKPFIETLRVTNPVRQSRASSRKRVLRGGWVTTPAKRRQRDQTPCD
jgi:hypothetical protein